jgi:hypothetical protein
LEQKQGEWISTFPPKTGVWNFYEMAIGSNSILLGFHQTGKYGATLCLSDYIVLDCRINNPKLPHPRRPSLFPCPLFRLLNISPESDLTNLHHVVFSDNFKNARILDNMLNPVLDGEFILLP